jgi:hypothetical protein
MQKGKSIHNFKPNNIITLIDAPNMDMPIQMEKKIKDYSLVGKKLKLINVVNASIYLEKLSLKETKPTNDSMGIDVNSMLNEMLSGMQQNPLGLGGDDANLIIIPLEKYKSGWDYWINPFDYDPNESLEDLEKLYDECIKNESYERASMIKEKIENKKRK